MTRYGLTLLFVCYCSETVRGKVALGPSNQADFLSARSDKIRFMRLKVLRTRREESDMTAAAILSAEDTRMATVANTNVSVREDYSQYLTPYQTAVLATSMMSDDSA